MGLFRKLFGGLKEPERPDDYYLASSIASTIDAFVASESLESLITDDWSVILRNNYGISLSLLGRGDDDRAVVLLRELDEMSQFKRIRNDNLMGNGPLGYMATDQLATAVLRKIKEQLGEI